MADRSRALYSCGLAPPSGSELPPRSERMAFLPPLPSITPPARTLTAAIALLTAVANPLAAQHAATGERLDAPRFSLHGFSDITWSGQRSTRGTGQAARSESFGLGQLDLYMVSLLGENVSFLAETVFELGRSQVFAADVERVLLSYTWSDLFKLAVGRGHTALGHWNEAYHHGVLLQPTVRRPQALRSEDGGGILPIHFVGMELSGTLPLGGWGLQYVANVANGRGATIDQVQNGNDVNSDKALALKLSLRRDGDRTIRFGPSLYRDLIPADSGNVTREGQIRQLILGSHFVYDDQRVQFMAEAYRVHDDEQQSGREFDHDAWYAVLVGKFGKWNPYVGIDGIDFAPGDPFYTSVGTDLRRILGGIRFDVNPFNALKLELRRDKRPGDTTNAIAIQTAFTF
jgi:hypothetical protein